MTIRGKGKSPVRYDLLLAFVNDSVTPRELISMGFSKSVAYRYSHRSKKIKEDYYVLRRQIREYRETVKPVMF